MASEARRRRSPLSAGQIGGLLLLVVAATFIVQNRRRTTIRFLIPEVTAPLWLALLVGVLIGVVAGALLAYRRNR